MLGLVLAQVGAVVAIASAVVMTRRWLVNDTTSRAYLLGAIAWVAALAYALSLAWAVAQRPARYAAALYARGGAPRTLQVVLCDLVGPRGVVAITVGMALLYVARGEGWRGAWRRRPWSRARAVPRLPVLALVGIAAAGVSAVVACASTGARPAGAAAAGNVVVVRPASFRFDRLDGQRAPYLTRLASRGYRFDAAYASLEAYDAPGELAPPPGHVARTVRAAAAVPARTVALLVPVIGTALGRLVAPAAHRAFVAGEPAAVVEEALAALDALTHTPRGADGGEGADAGAGEGNGAGAEPRGGVAPFFLVVELGDQAGTYAPTAPFATRFADPDYRGARKYLAPPPDDGLDDADRAQIRALYDGMAAEIDDAAGALHRALVARGLGASTSFVFTARHGASLFEDGLHRGIPTRFDGDEGTHVPLFVVENQGHEPDAVPPDDHVVRDVDLARALATLSLDARAPFGLGAAPSVAFAVAPTAPGALPEARARDAHGALTARPSREGVDYTWSGEAGGDAASLRAQLLAWRLRDAAVERRGDFVVPRRPALPFELRWVTVDPGAPAAAVAAVAARGVTFTHALANGGDLTARLAALREAVEVRDGPPPPGATPRPVLEIASAPWASAVPGAVVPLVIAAPGVVPPGVTVDAPVGLADVLPTVREVLGLEPSSRDRGAHSLVALARDPASAAASPWPVLVDGPRGRSLVFGGHELVVGKDGATRLFDRANDPAATRDLSRAEPDRAAELRARLDAATLGVPLAGSPEARREHGPEQIVHLRFAGAGAVHRITGELRLGEGSVPVRHVRIVPVELGPEAFTSRADGARVELSVTTLPDAVVGLDLAIDPPDANVTWALHLDDRPEPWAAIYAGPFGLRQPAVERGLHDERARFVAGIHPGDDVPRLDARRDLGMLVTRSFAR